jgi:anti-sigma regulatory factor (Ser/Thr protein kinase)
MAWRGGPASVGFDRLVVRLAVGLRVGGVAASCLGGLLGLAAPASPLAVILVTAGLAGWAACYASVALRRGLVGWLVIVDPLVIAVPCLAYRQLVATPGLPGWPSWLVVLASSAVVIGPLAPRRVLGAAALLIVPVAYAVGSRMAGQPAPGLCVLLFVQGVGTSLLLGRLRRHVRAVDGELRRLEALQRDAAVRSGRRAEEREHCRLLHDSVSATLTVVAGGALTASPVVRTQAWRDLAVLERIQAPPVPPAAESDDRTELSGRLAAIVTAQPGLTVEAEIGRVEVPTAVAGALAAAVSEALRNAARHAGVSRARVRAWAERDTVRVEVADEGRGFDPECVPAHRRGLRESVAARMARVGGSATVLASPGAGTRVLLRWPDAPAESSVPPTESSMPPTESSGRPAEVPAGGFAGLVTDRYQRGFDVAVIAITSVRHVANLLVLILGQRSAYRSLAAELVAWVVLAAVGVAAAVRVLRRRAGGSVPWPLIGVTLAASVLATAGVGDGSELTAATWSLGGAGWFAVLMLLRRPIRELAGVLLLNATLTYAVLAYDGITDRPGLARFLLMAYGFGALELGIAMVVRASDGTAARAAEAAERRAAVRSRGLVAEALHRSRLQRYELVGRSVVPLLVGLASGSFDPADAGVQRRCAVEASRLRRLFAETDDAPDPLLHELRACADIAHSRGVPVDLQVIGQLPALSRPVRRALTEAPLHLLAGARREARVTVFGAPGRVAVSVLADVPDDADPALEPLAAAGRFEPVTVQEWEVPTAETPRRWIEARWEPALAVHSP